MLDNAKRKAALLLHRFLQYWTTRAVKEQPRIDPTVYVMPNAYVSAEVAVGRYSYIRGGAQLESGSVGAFCSIAPDVLIGGDEHPLDAVSTHPFWYSPGGLTVPTGPGEDGGASLWSQPKPAPIIGNDVWIGAGAKVMRGAVIEDGAVIGAGAIVTGHIPAYAIAVGIPAKVVRYRFEPAQCERLRQTRWWEWPEAKIRENRRLFGDADAFLSGFEDEQRSSEESGRETGRLNGIRKGAAL
ncbi:CatB-related O-acetyltransferase [Cohnella faecalis]|uniref:Antibiotic acetyltransferase n=1 Tax=Cohnella faecalis TaxID=2315694 RepID=A0A398CV89_9BACL|nr:CatB-related O-acetyltransferase [Cohnella faecalis]RIE03807.1 antibiotic acetyltransferase [Cohnella faecalis]